LAVDGVVLHKYIYSHNNLHTRNTIIKWGFKVNTNMQNWKRKIMQHKTRCKQNPDTSKCVSPHAQAIVTIIGQGAQGPLQEKI